MKHFFTESQVHDESASDNESATHDQQQTSQNPNWRLYAAAGAAALAFTTGADASIIYSGPQDLQFRVPAGGTLKIGSEQVAVSGRHSAFVTTSGSNVNLGSLKMRFPNGYAIGVLGRDILKLNSGAAINTGHLTGAYGLLRGGLLRKASVIPSMNLRFSSNDFGTGQTGFIGLKFDAGVNGGGWGWIRVEPEAGADGVPDALEVVDWAYNDAGGGITAGQTVGPSVPEPSALGLLALGSAGVLAWRRRRNETAR